MKVSKRLNCPKTKYLKWEDKVQTVSVVQLLVIGNGLYQLLTLHKHICSCCGLEMSYRYRQYKELQGGPRFKL